MTYRIHNSIAPTDAESIPKVMGGKADIAKHPTGRAGNWKEAFHKLSESFDINWRW